MDGVAFAAFSLAPALSLPPQLPGIEGAPLLARELWWIGCVGSTAVGLGACVFARTYLFKLLGVALIVLPHVVGVPQEPVQGVLGEGPARLFALGSLATAFAMWSLIGILTATSMRRAEKARALASAATQVS